MIISIIKLNWKRKEGQQLLVFMGCLTACNSLIFFAIFRSVESNCKVKTWTEGLKRNTFDVEF